MPDFERVLDNLREQCSPTPESRSYAKGYTEGKTKARIQILLVLIAVTLIVAISEIGFLMSS
ncbi:hypothetical protein SAMN02982919_02243 [Giesbergeria anulus]|uniref:Uncharacterized protein n=1 Tax=Giesbergeria anulus TaxID=180197 RepID=A0A1H9NJS2_9BURK|nr:hypothetical protein SAMN02982919_02243 [Giesbergeria anulus]